MDSKYFSTLHAKIPKKILLKSTNLKIKTFEIEQNFQLAKVLIQNLHQQACILTYLDFTSIWGLK